MKKLFIALGLFVSIGFIFGTSTQKSFLNVHAEEEPVVEVVEEPSEEEPVIIDEEEQSIGQEISQVAKDIIAVMKDFFERPVVIAGISTTIGALALFIIGKAIGGISKKKLNDILAQLKGIKDSIDKKVEQKDYEGLKGEISGYYDILAELVSVCKNEKVKKDLQEKLEALKDVKQEVIEFAEEKVEEIKEESNEVGKKVNEIISK